MNTAVKSTLAALALTVFGAGAALAAEACDCCKDKAKMECCDKADAKSPDAKPTQPAQPAPEHKH